MERATANQQPNPADRWRKRRSYELYGSLCRERVDELSMLNVFRVFNASWTLKECKQAIQDLEMEELAVYNPNDGIVVVM